MAAVLSAEERDEMAIPSYRHPNPLLRWMAWRRVHLVLRSLKQWSDHTEVLRSERRVMDFGCGTGILFPSLAGEFGRIYGVDPVLTAARMTVQSCGLERIELMTPEETARLPPESMDVVICAEVLEHVDDLEDTIPLLRSKLKPGGLLLVSLPSENGLYRLGRRLAGFSGEYHHHSAASVDPLIRRLGFDQKRLTRTPLPGPFAIYWIIEYVKAREI